MLNRIVSLLFVATIFGTSLTAGQTLQQRLPIMFGSKIRSMASQYERLGQYEQAAQIYMKLSLENPKDVSNYLGAKRCLLALKDYQRLENFILQLQQKRRSVRYEVDLAEVEYLRGDEKKALAHWDKILIENPRSHEAYALVGMALTQHRLFDKALQVYKKARKSFKDETLFIFETANIHTLRSEFNEVAKDYLTYLRRNPRQTNFVQSRFNAIARDVDKREELIKALKKTSRKFTDIRPQVLQLLGGLYTLNRQYKEALEQYSEFELIRSEQDKKNKRRNKGQLLERFARAAEKDGAFEYAQKAYNLLLEKYPDSPYAIRARFGMARVLEEQKRYDEAIAAYEQFIRSHPNSVEALQAILRIGDMYFYNLFDLDKARQAYETVLKDYPGSAYRFDALFRLGDCSVAAGKLENAENIYQRALAEAQAKKGNNYKKALLALAQVEFYRGFPSGALKYLDMIINQKGKIFSSAPDVSENDALELYMTLVESKTDSMGLATLGKTRHLFLQRKYDECRNTIENFLAQDPPTLVGDELRLLLIKTYRQLGQYDLAIETCNQIVNNEKSLYRDLALKLRAEIFEYDLKDYRKAQDSFETLLANFPESIYIEEARKVVRLLEQKN